MSQFPEERMVYITLTGIFTFLLSTVLYLIQLHQLKSCKTPFYMRGIERVKNKFGAKNFAAVKVEIEEDCLNQLNF